MKRHDQSVSMSPYIKITMASSRKHIRVGEKSVYDTEIIYARAMGLQDSDREYEWI